MIKWGQLIAAGVIVLLTTAQTEARPVAVRVGGGVHVGGYYHPGYNHYPISTYHPEHPAYYNRNYYGYGSGYGWPGYYGGLYSLPSVNYNLNLAPPPPATLTVPTPTYQSFYPTPSYLPPPPAVGQPAQDPTTVRVNVRLPQANAQVTVDGAKTTQQGVARQFVSPPLTPGKKYGYTVEATWNDNGKEKSETRKVTVQAGQTVNIDFTQPQ